MNFIELQSCVAQLGAVCNGMQLALGFGRWVVGGGHASFSQIVADFEQVLLSQTLGCLGALGKI